MDIGTLFFSFSGRVNRAKFWATTLIFVIIALALAAIGYAAGQSLAFQLLNLILNIIVFISALAIGIKRLHDRDKSGWWIVLFYIAPSLLFTLAAITTLAGLEAGGIGLVGIIIYLAGLAILIWAIVELGCLRGTIGPNQYGPDPVAPAPAQP